MTDRLGALPVPAEADGHAPDGSTDITVLAVYVPETDRNPAVVTDQIRLAKQYGISGFAVVHDPSAGRRFERVLDVLAAQEETAFSFTAICVLRESTEPERLMDGLARYMRSGCWLRIDGKPVICVDNPEEVPDIGAVFDAWRSDAGARGLGDILIWACSPDAGTVPLQGAAEEELPDRAKPDALYELPPRGKDYATSCAIPDGGTAHDYGSLIEGARWFSTDGAGLPVYRGSMPDWNDKRVSRHGYDCWLGASPARFYLWNRINIRFLREHYRPQERILLVNAWNDRDHGAFLEPRSSQDRTYLNALSKAVRDLPYDSVPNEDSLYYLGAGSHRMQMDAGWHRELDEKALIAVHAHVFYSELTEEVLDYVSHIPFRFDLFISTDTAEKRERILQAVRQWGAEREARVTISLHPNRGRDVAPFLSDFQDRVDRYRYVCHIHTKKSGHQGFGNAWRRYLFRNLLGSETLVREILYMFEREPHLGVVLPQSLDIIRAGAKWLENREQADALMARMGFPDFLSKADESRKRKRNGSIVFPAGNMFWARTDAVRQLFSMDPGEYPEERGQLDGTVMHAIERIWCYLAQANGYRYRLTRYFGDNRLLDILKI